MLYQLASKMECREEGGGGGVERERERYRGGRDGEREREREREREIAREKYRKPCKLAECK